MDRKDLITIVIAKEAAATKNATVQTEGDRQIIKSLKNI